MRISAMAYYLPSNLVSTSDISLSLPSHIPFNIKGLTGIERIHQASSHESSLSMALKAVDKCLASTNITTDNIDYVIYCSISKIEGTNKVNIDPSTAAQIASHFQFDKASCFDVNNACAGVFTGLYIAQSLIKTAAARNVLVVSGEKITTLSEATYKACQHENNKNISEMLSTLTLGDSAVALLLENSHENIGFQSIELLSIPKYADLCTAYIDIYGASMYTKSAQLFTKGLQYATLHLNDTLKRNNWLATHIDWLITHQPSEKAIYSIASRCNHLLSNPSVFTSQNTLNNVKYRGNTSSTSHFIATLDAVYQGKIQTGNRIAYSIAASGLTIGSALYVFDNLPVYLNAKIQSSTFGQPCFLENQICLSIEQVSILSSDFQENRDIISMSKNVIKELLQTIEHPIDLVIFTGVIRTKLMSEPAIANFIIYHLCHENPSIKHLFSENLFCFDITNGAIGTSDAIRIGASILKHKKINKMLVIAAEDTMNPHHINPTASGIILSNQTNERLCLIDSQKYLFTKYINSTKVSATWTNGHITITTQHTQNLYEIYLKCIENALDKFFTNTHTTFQDYTYLFPPIISQEFNAMFVKKINIPQVLTFDIQQDFYTSNLAWLLKKIQSQLHTSGDKVLIVEVSSGIQVNISVWQFP